jgi:Domain of Unknown Function (DUF1206)
MAQQRMRGRSGRVTVRGMTSAAENKAHSIANSRAVEIGARVGLVSYGITHLIIAWIALQIAFGGGGGQKANQSGAFEELAQNTFGRILLWVLVVGFVAAALWRLEETIWGYTYESDNTTRIRKRVSSGAKVVVFATLAFLAGRTAAGSGSGGSGGQKAAAGVLGLPGGQLIVGAVGLGVVAVGGYKIYSGIKKKFLSDMDLPSDQRARQVAERSGQVGFIGKGAATALIGVLVVLAAIRFRPDEASGLDVALRTLAQQPFGPWLLAAVALGLAAYGVFLFFDARYHRV